MRRIAIVAIAVAGVALALPAQAQQFNFEGCPFYSDQGCTLIRGADGITYNITSARPQPRIRYRPISGSGWAAASLDICFAKPLDHIRWRYTRQRCR
jgi:hypothetical protein